MPAERWPALFDRAAELKRDRLQRTLAGKSVALVFEKASTRTRVSFEVGVFELGGHAVVLTSQGSQLARGEPIEDTARVLSGYCHAIVMRTFGQDRLVALARAASVPVINALTDQHHPCQVATDLFTVREALRHDRRALRVGRRRQQHGAFVDRSRRRCSGSISSLACPHGFRPDPMTILAQRAGAPARARPRLACGSTDDPNVAVAGAHVISTDVWASMGQEADAERASEGVRGLSA